jgi:large subunit ribosomal protein L14
MKGMTSKITKTLVPLSRIKCDDNSGAQLLKIIGLKSYKGVRNRYPAAGVGSTVICSVVKGDTKMVGTKVIAVITRQRKEFKRPNGTRISFEDNAAVLINEDGLPIGTEIKGAIAREVAERYPKVSAIAAVVM